VPDASQYELFSDLLRQNYRRLYAFIYSLVRDFSDTEELLQETSLLLWQKFDEFDPQSNFGAWSCQVAKFTVLNFLRKESHRARFSDTFQEHLLTIAATPAPADEPWRDALEHCVDALPADQREMLWDFYRGTKTVESIAAEQAREPQGIYGSLHHIRRKLLECMNRRLGREANS